jgi:hypothetical protein
MRRRLMTVQQPGLGQKERAGTDRRQERARVVHMPKPLDFAQVSSLGGIVDGRVHVAHDNGVGGVVLADRHVRLDRDVAHAAERFSIGRHDPDIEHFIAGRSRYHFVEHRSRGLQDVVEPVEHRCRRLGRGEQQDPGSFGGAQDVLLSETARFRRICHVCLSSMPRL